MRRGPPRSIEPRYTRGVPFPCDDECLYPGSHSPQPVGCEISRVAVKHFAVIWATHPFIVKDESHSERPALDGITPSSGITGESLAHAMHLRKMAMPGGGSS